MRALTVVWQRFPRPAVVYNVDEARIAVVRAQVRILGAEGDERSERGMWGERNGVVMVWRGRGEGEGEGEGEERERER